MKTLILAGGRGTRLRPQVSSVPKPMAEVAGRPFLEWQVELLRAHDLREIVFSIGYEGEVIRNHFGDGSAFGIDATYAEEEEPRGTGGAVKNAASVLGDEPFFVLNGDTYLDVDYRDLAAFHLDRPERVTLALSRVDAEKTGGFVELSGDRVERLVRERQETGLVNAGVHVFDPSVFDVMPDETKFSLERVIEDLVAAGDVAGFPTDAYFKDMGTPERYREINEELPAVAAKHASDEGERAAGTEHADDTDHATGGGTPTDSEGD